MSDPIHASAVSYENRAVLILGTTGAGKSRLALDLIALGATLVADDQVSLTATARGLLAKPPPQLAGRIEARGIGIIRTDWSPGIVTLVADLNNPPEGRLPAPNTISIEGQVLPRISIQGLEGAASAILAILKGGLETHS